MPIHFLRSFFLTFVLIPLCFSTSFGQQEIGVVWSPPSNNQLALQQLDTFTELGASRLIISRTLDEELWKRIDSLEFQVHGTLPIRYPITSTFSVSDSSLIEDISYTTNHFLNQPLVQSIGLFSFGQERSTSFKQALQTIQRQIKSVFAGPLYYISRNTSPTVTDPLFDYKIVAIKGSEANQIQQFSVSNVGGIIYEANDYLLAPVKHTLSIAQQDSLPVFFKGEWLISATQKYPEFRKTLQHYSTTSELVFPLPVQKQASSPGHSFIVILLLSVLALFVLNYQYSPVYKKTISRYFLAHKFLVDDIMDRHIRSSVPAIIIIIQHIITTGIVMYCLVNVLFTSHGLDALQYHFPQLMIVPSYSISFFLWGCLLSFVVSLLSILWIRFSNKKVSHISQVILLYSWPLQLNIVITALIVTLMISGFSPTLMLLLCGLYFLIHFGSFIITAIDTSNYLAANKTWFLVGTVALYTVLITGALLWLGLQPIFIEVMSLAVSIP